MASFLSRIVYRGLVGLHAPGLVRSLRPTAPIFCFHNVVYPQDVGAGDTSLHMPVQTFGSIVAWLRVSYEVVPLRDLVERVRARQSVRGLAAITFDDAYRGVFANALPILRRVGAPCTIFVVAGFADRPTGTWWDILGSRGLLTNQRRDEALTVHRGLAPEILRTLDLDGPSIDLPEALLPAPWDEILENVGDHVVLGSHTARHPNLSVMTDEELDVEMQSSKRAIAEASGTGPAAVAYPYGLWNSRVVRAAERAGYASGLALDARPARSADDLFRLPRINVPAGISVDALACWAAGIKPERSS